MSFRNYKIQYLIPTILILGYLIYLTAHFTIGWIVCTCELKENPFSPFSLTLTSVALLFLFFDQVLWKLPLFNVLVEYPDISGRYEGNIVRKFESGASVNTTFTAAAEIEQTASSIRIIFYTKTEEGKCFTSVSEHVAIINHSKTNLKLMYLYLLSPKGAMSQTQIGANILELNTNSKNLDGTYFSEQGNRGEINLKFSSKSIKGML